MTCDLLHGRLLARLLGARPFARILGGLVEQASFPTHAGLARSRVVHLLEHARHAQQVRRFEGAHIRKQRLGVGQVADHAVVGCDRSILDEPCEAVCKRQEQQQTWMVVGDHLMQGEACRARDGNEVAVGKLDALRRTRGTGRVHDGGQIVGGHRVDALGQLLVGNRDAHAFQCAHRIRFEHEDMLQARAVVDYRIKTVEAFSIVGDGEFYGGIIDDAFGLRRGIRVVDRYAHGSDRGQGEVEHAPLVAGGREDGDRVPFADSERDQALGRGDHGLMEFAGGDVGPPSRSGLACRDDGVFAGTFDAFGEHGVDGFVVAYLNGSARGRVLGEHEAFSFLADPRVSRARSVRSADWCRTPLSAPHIIRLAAWSLHCEKRQETFDVFCVN